MRVAIWLALADYRHELLLSFCSILAMAAAITPILVLIGINHGIISSMTDNLLNDPRNLEVIPVGSGKYDCPWLEQLSREKGVAFLLPQTRPIAATITLAPMPDKVGGMESAAGMIATKEGDPLLERWLFRQADTAAVNTSSALDLTRFPDFIGIDYSRMPLPLPMIVSFNSARKTGLSVGDVIQGELKRTRNRRKESVYIPLYVAAILPLEAQQKEAVYVPLSLTVLAEDYRDGYSLPMFGADGPQAPVREYYPSFRLYASDLDSVAELRERLETLHVQTHTQAEAIDTVNRLDAAFTVVVMLVSGATFFGLAASVASSALAGVRRKARSLGVISLLGIGKTGRIIFPLVQSVITAFFGTCMAFVLYSAVALAINHYFKDIIPRDGVVCSLLPAHVLLIASLVVGLSFLASVAAARQAVAIEPSEVIRDV